MNYFYFYKVMPSFENLGDSRILLVPAEICDKHKLFEIYEKLLSIPEEFGENWDAFYDNLGSLYFIQEKIICLIHSDLPFASDEKNKRIYLETLFDAVSEWWESPEHKLYVYFPEKNKSEVENIIETRDYS